MRKWLCAVMALLLLCPFGCSRAETGSSRLPFEPSRHLETRWHKWIPSGEDPYHSEEELSVFSDGETTLKHDRVKYRMKRSGDRFLLEKDLYETPLDAEAPYMTLSAGEIRLWENGEAVQIEVVSDPLGIFAGFSAEDLTLPLRSNKPYRAPAQTSWEFGTDPQFQPHTKWFDRGRRVNDDGLISFAACSLETQADGVVRGWFRQNAEGGWEDCLLLWSPDAAALVKSNDRELLLYGAVLGERDGGDSLEYGQYYIRANYDPYGVNVGGKLMLRKGGMAEDPEPEYVLGYGRYEIEVRFTDHGWASEPLSWTWWEDAEKEDDYGTNFLKLTKDGKLLLIYLDGLYEYDLHACAYVLIDGSGALESWGGMKPVDHALVDAATKPEDLPAELGDRGLWGIWEDDRVLLLDDGRVLAIYLDHETWDILAFTLFDPWDEG